MKEYKLVPQADLDALEVARIALHGYLEKIGVSKARNCHVADITKPMWNLTHKKYHNAVNYSENND